eukprot:191793-Hanusia_phi.AAC.3
MFTWGHLATTNHSRFQSSSFSSTIIGTCGRITYQILIKSSLKVSCFSSASELLPSYQLLPSPPPLIAPILHLPAAAASSHASLPGKVLQGVGCYG